MKQPRLLITETFITDIDSERRQNLQAMVDRYLLLTLQNEPANLTGSESPEPEAGEL